ncbi:MULTISPECIES: hemerythrin domain-containing protein [Pseudomonas]|uniref:hemerythrin domain-containing protein n=1 Tax=Pseudomonas sp. MIL9 TaxID=2807620 RepID=UPI001029D910|nr:hemerythrin domain-containing protein [Pseudomonas sp. MIL9]MBM6446777.1 hemerythrin domain-containing protein [Pseudomonas sp. MIL9]RZO05628.1 hemerythrin domain-containing protein [Pseudomonas moorei]
MNVLLKELHAYHHEVAVKITQIKESLRKLRHESNGADDCKLLFTMLEALHDDAERHHHENEELIRLALLATEAPIHQRVKDIERDHQAFGRIAGQLKMLENTTQETSVIADTVDDFIKKYYDHMEAEENIFFPVADKWLSDSQWQEIKRQWH